MGLPLLAEPLPQQSSKAQEKDAAGKEPEVTATEDLMREHGVLRRALLVFLEVVPKLRQNAAVVDAAALQQTAKLFRTFGEDYHERMLEEQHIFPLIRKQAQNSSAMPTFWSSNTIADAKSRITYSRSRMDPGFQSRTLSRWRRCWRPSSSCIRTMRRERTRLCFPHGRRILPTSSSTKSPINLKTSNTRCLAKMDSKTRRKRSARWKPHLDSPTWRSSHRLLLQNHSGTTKVTESAE